MARVSNTERVDVSLRMWSNESNIFTMLRDIDFDIAVLHVKGEPIRMNGKTLGRVAERNFISVEHRKMDNDAELHNWLTNIVGKMLSKRVLIDAISMGQVEALIWIAIFGYKPAELPRITPNILLSCSDSRLKIMCENYTDFDADGVPKRVWLTQ